MKTLVLMLALATALSACGVRGNPEPVNLAVSPAVNPARQT
jgi:predicted small lipoprotein YifL